MTNIDFSYLVTAQDKAAEAAAVRRDWIKSLCKARILAQFPAAAQQNITQAIALYVWSNRADSAQHEMGDDVQPFTAADLTQAFAAQKWIGQMQRAGRSLSTDIELDPRDDSHWPEAPQGMMDLVARF